MIGTPEQLSKYLWQLDKDKQYEIKEILGDTEFKDLKNEISTCCNLPFRA